MITAFEEKIMKCKYENTYKMALARSLCDFGIATCVDNNILSLLDIAEYFVSYY